MTLVVCLFVCQENIPSSFLLFDSCSLLVFFLVLYTNVCAVYVGCVVCVICVVCVCFFFGLFVLVSLCFPLVIEVIHDIEGNELN